MGCKENKTEGERTLCKELVPWKCSSQQNLYKGKPTILRCFKCLCKPHECLLGCKSHCVESCLCPGTYHAMSWMFLLTLPAVAVKILSTGKITQSLERSVHVQVAQSHSDHSLYMYILQLTHAHKHTMQCPNKIYNRQLCNYSSLWIGS